MIRLTKKLVRCWISWSPSLTSPTPFKTRGKSTFNGVWDPSMKPKIIKKLKFFIFFFQSWTFIFCMGGFFGSLISFLMVPEPHIGFFGGWGWSGGGGFNGGYPTPITSRDDVFCNSWNDRTLSQWTTLNPKERYR